MFWRAMRSACRCNKVSHYLQARERRGAGPAEKWRSRSDPASSPPVLGWAGTEGYPVDGTVDSDGQYSKADIPEHTQYDTQSLAKFAFSMFWRAMRFAEEQQVPILLDY